AGENNGAKLAAKDVTLLEAKPNGAPTEEWIHFLRHLQVRKKFVAAQVQGANNDRAGLQCGGDLAVSLILLFFRWQGVPIDEQVFGAEQPDSLRAALDYALGIGRLFNVRREHHADAIERDRGLFTGFAQLLLKRDLPARELPIFEQRLVG